MTKKRSLRRHGWNAAFVGSVIGSAVASLLGESTEEVEPEADPEEKKSPWIFEGIPTIDQCHIIGATTISEEHESVGGGMKPASSSAPAHAIYRGEIRPGKWHQMSIDSGDAPLFVPYYISVVGYAVINGYLQPSTRAPVLLQDSTSGREPNLRRANPLDASFGILFPGDDCWVRTMDWRPFASVMNRQLIITLFNPSNVDVHVFIKIAGLPAVAIPDDEGVGRWQTLRENESLPDNPMSSRPPTDGLEET